MPNNINKVVFGNNTLMDLTNDTVSDDNLLEGETAHDKSGTPVIGTAKQGHSILNKLGTLLTQRNKLKFGGMLKITDDSTNEITVVSDEAEEIEWSVWSAMTEAERDAYSAGKKLDIVNAPWVSGRIPVELIKTLWTNPNPTAEFAPQNIVLASNDYDFLHIVCKVSTSIDREVTSLIEAENTGFITTTFATTGGINMYQRTIQYTSKTVLSMTDAYKITNGTYGGVDNTTIIPIAIYGLKSSVTVDVSKIIVDESTKAEKTDIATVESGSTASRAYSVGELVYVNGNLYEVITTIASGATFTVNTNIKTANVSDTYKGVFTSIQDLQGRTNFKWGTMNVDVSTAVSGVTPFSYRGSNGTSEKNILAVIPLSPSSNWIVNVSCRKSGNVDIVDVWANSSGTITVRYLYVDK